MIFVLTLLAASLSPPELVIRDHVDAIESNFLYDEQGRLVFQQLIYYAWPASDERHSVIAWRLVKDQSQVPQRDWRNGGYTSLFHDPANGHEPLRLITTPSFYESHTQTDIELTEREFLPKEKRRELSDPRAKQPRRLSDGAFTTFAEKEQSMAEMILGGVRYRAIPGFSRYYASENGDVGTFLMRGNPSRTDGPFRLIKQTRCRQTGYLYMTLSDDSRRIQRISGHKCVLLTFVGECPPGMEACHDPDPTRTNNQLSNLRWDTRKNNHADKWKHGTQQAGEQNAQSILRDADVLSIKTRIVNGETLKAIAADYGVDWTTISLIRTGKHWRHVAPELNAMFPAKRIPTESGISVRQMAIARGLNPGLVHKRLQKGFTIEQAMSPVSIRGCRRFVAEQRLRATA